MLTPKQIFEKIKDENPNLDWLNLDGQGFYELMQTYRNANITEQDKVIESFEVVKEFICWWALARVKQAITYS